jgi:phosphocarrier protein HPr
MISRKAVIANKQGIHVRPSKVIAAAAAGYPGSIVIRKGSYEIDTLNTMNLLTLALLEHDRITVEVRGPDEQAMIDKLIQLFETHFDFPAKT